jgi:predicted RNA-binding Zn ribbon-like protein
MKGKKSSRFLFVGGHPCLDFLNTQIVDEGKPKDLLTNYGDFLDWLSDAGVLNSHQSDELQKKWGKKEEETLMRSVKHFRSQLRSFVKRLPKKESASSEVLDEINRILEQRTRYLKVLQQARKFQQIWFHKYERPAHLLVPIAEMASDLLCNVDFHQLKQCGNPNCILQFYDTSKNHSRRWCSMNVCGNRMKAALHYRRSRGNN